MLGVIVDRMNIIGCLEIVCINLSLALEDNKPSNEHHVWSIMNSHQICLWYSTYECNQLACTSKWQKLFKLSTFGLRLLTKKPLPSVSNVRTKKMVISNIIRDYFVILLYWELLSLFVSCYISKNKNNYFSKR